MDYRKIISPSGFEHLVSDVPRYVDYSAAIVSGRVQTLCEMHFRPDEIDKADGTHVKPCVLCLEEARRRENEAAAPLRPAPAPAPVTSRKRRRK